MEWVETTLFSHQSFTDYDSIISKVCDAWNRFLDRSKRVTKMSSRRWIDLTS
ncbi:transposase [Vibrio parahaemolyticus]|nr:transposase [Vibrio parahaemolyticus]